MFTEVVKPSFFCMQLINVILYKEAVPRHKSISLRVFTFLKMHLLAFSLNSDFIKIQSIELGGHHHRWACLLLDLVPTGKFQNPGTVWSHSAHKGPHIFPTNRIRNLSHKQFALVTPFLLGKTGRQQRAIVRKPLLSSHVPLGRPGTMGDDRR